MLAHRIIGNKHPPRLNENLVNRGRALLIGLIVKKIVLFSFEETYNRETSH